MTSGIDVTAEGYEPGACNIGREEVAKRQRIAVLGAAAAAAWIVATLVVGAPPLVRALAAFPAAGAFLSWYEARRRFCVAYATLGVYRLGPGNPYRRVTDRSARVRDVRALVPPLVASLVVGLTVAVLALLIP